MEKGVYCKHRCLLEIKVRKMAWLLEQLGEVFENLDSPDYFFKNSSIYMTEKTAAESPQNFSHLYRDRECDALNPSVKLWEKKLVGSAWVRSSPVNNYVRGG